MFTRLKAEAFTFPNLKEGQREGGREVGRETDRQTVKEMRREGEQDNRWAEDGIKL